MDSPNKKVINSCQYCKFALSDEEDGVKTQTGCAFGVTDQVEKIEAYNENGNFYILPDFVCQFHRLNNSEDTAEMVRKSVEPTYDIVLISTNKEDTLEALTNIKKAKIQPSYLKLVLQADDHHWKDEIINILKDSAFKYKICYLIEELSSIDDADLYMQETNSRSTWYQYCHDYEYNSNDIETIDKLLNEKIAAICIFKKMTGGFFLMRHIHNAIGGAHSIQEIPNSLCLII